MCSASPSSVPGEMSRNLLTHSLTIKSSVDCEGLLLQSENNTWDLKECTRTLHGLIMDNLILNPICITISS